MSQVRNRVNLGVLTALPSQADEGDSCIYDGSFWIYVNNTWTKIGKGSMGFNLFDLKLVDRVLTGDDAVNWGLLNTATGSPSITSPANTDFYEKVISIFNSLAANTNEEQGDVRWDESGNGYYKISDTTAQNYINQQYTEYGIAWYYGIDTTYQRIYLPRIKYANLDGGNIVNGQNLKYPIYLYMCVGNTIVNDSETNWNQLNTALQTEIDNSYHKVSSDNNLIAKLSAPDRTRMIQLTLNTDGSSKSFVAPAAGYYGIQKFSTGTNQYVLAKNTSTGLGLQPRSTNNQQGLIAFTECNEGDTCSLGWSAAGEFIDQGAVFVYKTGSQESQGEQN